MGIFLWASYPCAPLMLAASHYSPNAAPNTLSPSPQNSPSLMLEGGMAFGTGEHPTTRLCCNWLQRQVPSAVQYFGQAGGERASARAQERERGERETTGFEPFERERGRHPLGSTRRVGFMGLGCLGFGGMFGTGEHPTTRNWFQRQVQKCLAHKKTPTLLGSP